MRKALLSLSQEATIEIYLLTSNLLFTFLSSSSDYGDLHHHSHRRYRQGMPISHSLFVFRFSPTVLVFLIKPCNLCAPYYGFFDSSPCASSFSFGNLRRFPDGYFLFRRFSWILKRGYFLFIYLFFECVVIS